MNFEINSITRENIKSLSPYSTARDDFKGTAKVFLDANENPFSNLFNRYPDPNQKKLKLKIGELKNVSSENIFLGNGSDEVIDLLFRAFCNPGKDEVLIPQPTYGMYSVAAQINNIKVNSVSLTKTFDISLNEVLKSITPNTKLIFLCNPNNPSGNLLSAKKIIKILKTFRGLVILDEAYIDFAPAKSFVSKLNNYKNLVVLQTLSKAWSLASLRIGMCFASAEIVSVLNKIKPPYNISGLTQSVALKQLNRVNKKNKEVMKIVSQRKKLINQLTQLNCVKKIFPSDANFILIKMERSKEVYQKLLKKGIVVRNRSNILLCNDCLRITIGTPRENNILVQQLKAL
ncbi:MAG: histidinol-phosphate transaminase [Bacteroidetes bacterium]|nr:histidinol-phosphate transaminase [Bacteroidota bacterium]